MNKNQRQLGYIGLNLLATCFLATGGIFVKLSALPPIATGFYRILFSIIALYPLVKIDLQSVKIDKKDLLKNPYINLKVEGFDFPVEYNINYFMMTFNTSKNTEAPLVSKSNKFTPEMIEKIKTLKKGDKIYIEGIHAIGDDSKEVKVANPQMIFTIK